MGQITTSLLARRRFQRRLSHRDLRALRFVGEGYEVAQYQLQAAVFGRLSPTVTSRFVQRMLVRRLMATERHAGVGMNLLRLTRAGREALSSGDGSIDTVFAPTRAVALKDLVHTLRINDLRVVLATLPNAPARLLSSWSLQRSLRDNVVPDLLAVWQTTDGRSATLACEIDLGTESANACFIPKLRKLAQSLDEAAGCGGRLLVLTQGRRRLQILRDLTSELDGLIVAELPNALGPEGLIQMRQQLDL